MELRIGKVVSVDGRKARVYFPDTETVSDWLTVVRTTPSVTHSEGISVSLSAWTPQIDSIVLCAYLPGFNSDGFVIGGL